MKEVLISIKPKWCADIVSEKKAIEVRKSRPKLEPPFKCLIYCTKDKYEHLYDLRPYTNGTLSLSVSKHNSTSLVAGNYWNGKVIGEFVCEKISSWKDHEIHISNLSKLSCVSFSELGEYSKGGKDNLYGWHISDVKIYDKPKELSEFCSTKWDMPCEYKKRGFNMDFCMVYENGIRFCKELNCDKKRLTRPPQSWCYIED